MAIVSSLEKEIENHPTSQRVIEILVKAVLISSNNLRESAIKGLKRAYKIYQETCRESLLGIFIGDNQIFLSFGKDRVERIVYVCDLPKNYQEIVQSRIYF